MIASPLLYWTLVGLAAGVYLGVNFYFRQTVLPRCLPQYYTRRREIVGHWLPQTVLLASLVLLLQLFVAPLLLMSALLVCLLLANNKKFTVLNEPLLPCDIALTLRQLHVWRLLGQYVRRDRSVMILLPAALAATVVVLAWEPRLLGYYNIWLGLLSPALMAIAFVPPRGKSLTIRLLDWQNVPYFEWDTSTSVAAGGFFPTFLRSMDNVPRPAARSIGAADARVVLDMRFGENGDCNNLREDRDCSPLDQKPHIVVVLAEAFVDPRELGLVVEPEPLANYDEAVRRSVYSGRACVPVYGGWTVRSEYSLLTGIDTAAFANNIGNPNSTLVSPATHSLAKTPQNAGIPHGNRSSLRPPILWPWQRQCVAGVRRFSRRGQICRRGPRRTIHRRRGRRGEDRRGTSTGRMPDVPVLRHD